MIYGTADQVSVPDLDILTLLFGMLVKINLSQPIPPLQCTSKTGTPDSRHSRSQEHTALHAEASSPLEVITKSHARALTAQFAYFLRHNYGVGASGPGKDIVVAVSTGQSALPCVFYGVIAAEGIYSAASPSGTPGDLARQIKDGPGNVLVCSEDLRRTALEAARLAGLPERNVLVLASHPEVKLESADGSLKCDFKNSLPWQPITDPKVLADRTICILYSSGTTGLPKGVLVSHANVVSEVFLPNAVSRPVLDERHRQGRGWVKRTLAHLPTAHIAGVQGYFINPIFEGGIVYWMPAFNLDDFVRYSAELGVTTFFSVPPIYAAIAKHPGVKDQFSRVRQAAGGAAPLSREIQQAASDKIAPDAVVTQVWGLSETTGAVTHTPPDRMDTIGSLSPLLPNVTLR